MEQLTPEASDPKLLAGRAQWLATKRLSKRFGISFVKGVLKIDRGFKKKKNDE